MSRFRGGWPFPGQFPNIPFRLNKNSPQAEGLVGWWPIFPDIGRSQLTDYSGNNNHLTINNYDRADFNRVGSRDQNLETAYYFNDTDDSYASIGHRPVLDITDAITIYCTFSLREANLGQILSKGRGGTWGNYTFQVAGGSAFYFRYAGATDDPSTFDVSTSASLLDTVQVVAFRYIFGVPDSADIVWNGLLNDAAPEISGAEWIAGHGDEAPSAGSGPLELGRMATSSADYTDANVWEARICNAYHSISTMKAAYAPQTRWELYEPIPRIFPVGVAPADGDLSVNVSDDLTVSDSTVVSFVFLPFRSVSVQDDATIADTTTADIQLDIVAQDDATIADSVTADLQIDTAVQDDLTTTDTATADLQIGVLVQDDATIADSISTTVSNPALLVQDDATITDSTTVDIPAAGVAALDVDISTSANYVQIV